MPDADPPAGALTYDPELGPGYFVQTRSDFLRHEGFSPTVTRLYQVLLTYCGNGDTAWPGQDRLARECGGLSVPTIRKALDELIAAGLVTETRRGLNRTNLYHVHKLPLVLPTRDTKNIAIQSKKSLGTRIKVPRPKVHSEQTESVETGSDANLRAFFDSQIRALCRERHWPPPLRADLDTLYATGYDALVVRNTASLGCLGSMQELIAAFRPGGLGPLGLGK